MNYLSFKEFVNKYRLKNEATSNVEIKEILKLMNTSCGIYMKDDKFITTSGIVNLHPTKGTHWVMFVNEFYFDSYGCPPPLNITKQIIMVSIQNIKSRKTTVIVRRIVCMCCFSQL